MAENEERGPVVPLLAECRGSPPEYASPGSAGADRLFQVRLHARRRVRYRRGEKKLLATVRYQPYTGLPYLDIPVERMVYFMYPDPQYYELKPLSPTSVIVDILSVDSGMTKIIQQFIDMLRTRCSNCEPNGATLWSAGHLKTFADFK